jgi:hypothetical protein
MKALTIISAIFLLTSVLINGQEYVPFPLEDATWNIYLESTCDNDSPPDTFLLRYYFEGDTVISDVTYSHLFRESGDTIHPIKTSAGGIREDNKRVYFIGDDFLMSPGTGEELLLYDFNMQINDTIYHSPDGIWKSVVLDIDSIQIGETYRKRYKVNNGWYFHNPDYIIEGIGSIVNGLLGHITDIPTCGTHYWEHVCFFSANQLIYMNPTFSDCSAGVNLNSIKDRISSVITIYPNPFNEFISIINSSYKGSISIQVFNAMEQVILGSTKIEQEEIIPIPGSTGLYIAIVKDEEGKVLKKQKLLKE